MSRINEPKTLPLEDVNFAKHFSPRLLLDVLSGANFCPFTALFLTDSITLFLENPYFIGLTDYSLLIFLVTFR